MVTLGRKSGGVMGEGCIGAVGRGEGARQKEMVYSQSLLLTHHAYPSPVCGRQYLAGLALAGACGLEMGATWGCHVGSAQAGDSPARKIRSAATTPKDVVGSDWSTRRQTGRRSQPARATQPNHHLGGAVIAMLALV